MSLVLVPAGLVVAAVLAVWLRLRFQGAAARGGLRAMRGRTARHVRLVAGTLLVRADPRTVAGLVAPVVAARPTLFVPAAPDRGETLAWTSTSSLTPGLPRLVVRASAVPGWTEFGAVTYAWTMRFPQGGRFVKRVVPPARPVLEAAGLEVVELLRQFDPPYPGPVGDGPRHALPIARPSLQDVPRNSD